MLSPKLMQKMLQCTLDSNTEVYGNDPKVHVSTKRQQRCLRLTEHFYRNIREPVSQLICWSPKYGRTLGGIGEDILYHSLF